MKRTVGCVWMALVASLAFADASTCHVVGGTDVFRSFLRAVAEKGNKYYKRKESVN